MTSFAAVSVTVLAIVGVQRADAATFAATASVAPEAQYLGDSAGTTFTLTVNNTGTLSSIGAVQINRPSTAWTITACPTAPPGWSTQRSDVVCRYRSMAGTADDLRPGQSSSAFTFVASVITSTANLTGTWPVTVSKSDSFDTKSLVSSAASTAPGLTITAYTFQVTDAVVDPSAITPGAPCPAPKKSALAGSPGHVIVICGRNRALLASTPNQTNSSLAGTFVGSHGAFASGLIIPTSAPVILGSWSNVTVTASAGTGKTVIAKIGSATNRTSPLTTLTGYDALSANVPSVLDRSVSVSEDGSATLSLSGTSPTGSALTFAVTNDVDHGTLTATGAVSCSGATPNVCTRPYSYTPAANYNGPDSFAYTASDGSATSAAGAGSITVNPVNDTPTAADDSMSVAEDGSAPVDLGALVSDVETADANLTYSIVAAPGHGSLSGTGTARTYSPAANFNGTDSFTYQVTDRGDPDGCSAAPCDAAKTSATRTISITVNPVNDVPTAVNDSGSTDEDTALNVAAPGVLANDTDPDAGDTKTVVALNGSGTLTRTLASGASVTINANGSYSYDPQSAFQSLNTGQTATDTFSYSMQDAAGAGSSATVTITIHGADEADVPPVAVNDSATVTEDSGGNAIDVLANDTDVDGGPKAVASVTQPANGTVAITGGGTGVSYTPNANYCNTPSGAKDTFTYTLSPGGSSATVSMTVTCVDDPPTAVDDLATVNEDSGANALSVLANDTDIDGGPKSVTSVTQPANGTVAITGGGTGVSYTPNANYCNAPSGAKDTFTYTLSPGGSSATVSMTVTCVNDLPTAVDDGATTDEDTTLNVAAPGVLANDTDPDAGDTKTVTALNGSGTLTQALPSGASVTINADGSYSYSPQSAFQSLNTGESATDAFSYDMQDSAGAGSSATVTITIHGITDADVPPVAVNDGATVAEDSSANPINVLTNDTDVDGGPKAIASVTQPANGGVAITGGGTALTYTPNANYCNLPPASALDTFTYTLTPGSSTATVSITVTCVNDAPDVVTSAGTTAYTENDGPTVIDSAVTVTDVDPGATITSASVAITANFSSGQDTLALGGSHPGISASYSANTLTLSGTATPAAYESALRDVTYLNSSDAPSTLQRTVTFRVTDNTALQDSDLKLLQVTAVDDAPTAVDDSRTVTEDSTSNAISVLGNDTDLDGGPKSVDSVTQPVNGTVVNNGTSVSYTPNTNYCNNPPGAALDTFTYTLNGGSTANVSVTVTCVDDAPAAVNDLASVNEDSGATAIDVLANDTDIDGGPISIEAVIQPANGTVAITGGGTGLTYTPNANYCNNPPGSALSTFRYDLAPGTSTAIVSVTVNCIDDPPVAVDDSATVNEDSVSNTLVVLPNDADIDFGPKSVASVIQPANGTVALGGPTGLTYTPNANYCNNPPGTTPDTFTYTLAPGGSTATVSVTVTCVDDAPAPVDDTATVSEDSGTTSIDVLANDTDIDGGPRSITAISQPVGGTVVITGGGTGLTFTPNANYCNNPPGTTLSTFLYTVNGASHATVTVTVNCVNDAPTAVNDSGTTDEDTTLNVGNPGVLGNDTDADAFDTKTVVSLNGSGALTQTLPSGASVTINANGSYSYDPQSAFQSLNSGDTATDTFTYTMQDGAGAGSSATVTITINGVTDADVPPVAVNDAATVAEDSTSNPINLLTNDTDTDGGPKVVASVTQPANGAVVITGGGTGVSYTPNENYCNLPPGTSVDTFTYTLSPGGSNATVSITVTCVDDAPVAVNDAATVTEDSGANAIDVLANDTDVDGGAKSVASVTQPASGSVSIAGGGTGLTYMPTADFCSATPVTFAYTLNGGSTATVSITVTCVDDAPVAVNDVATVAEDSGASAITVLANDTDIDGGPKSVASVTQPANGAVVITGGGTGLTYAPNTDYCNNPPGTTPSTFSYTLNGGSSATVTVTVTCVNDVPSAVNDSATTDEDTTLTAAAPGVLGNDTDPDAGDTKTVVALNGSGTLTQTLVSGASVTINVDGSYSYNPQSAFQSLNFGDTATDTFDYTMQDAAGAGSSATVTLTITGVTDADVPPVAVDDAATVAEDSGANPITVLANDTDTDGGPKLVASVTQPTNGAVVVTGSGTGLTYQPNANYCNFPSGTADTFTYTLTPGGSTATVTMTVTCIDDAPVAVNDSATVSEDAGATAINVLSNDTDVDGGAKSIASTTQPGNGTVVTTGGGSGLTYQPPANFCSATPVTFTYTLTPGGSTATVSVTVTCVDDAPVAVNDAATVTEDAAAAAITVLTNDTDIDAGPRSIASTTQPTNGTVVITGGGTGLTYQPAANYCNNPPGTTLDTFTYTLSPGTSTATVTVTVTCVDDAPNAVNDSASVTEDAAATAISVLANDTDIDGGTKLVNSVTQPANGTVVITGGGTGLTYQSAANYCNNPPGTTLSTFTYTLTPGTSTATVTVTVTCVDDAPVAVNDAATVAEDSGANPINVLPNDTDVDGGPKSIASVTQPANGAVVITGGGTGLTFQPTANFCSATPTTFTYTLNGGSTATVSVTVTCVDDAPVAVNDAATVAEDSGATAITVLTNDTDIDAGPKSIASVTQPASGTVAITGGGTGLTYAPPANFCSATPVTFTYTLTPGGSVGTVSVTVTCVDDPPVAVNDAATVAEDSGATTITVLTNDTDIDAGPKTIASVTQSANGAVVITGGGTGLTFQPAANFCSATPTTFTYTLNGGSTATVSVTVTCVDDPPVAVNDAATVAEDAPATAIGVLTNDTDIDAGPKTIASVTQSANGAVVITGGGTGLTFQPAANFCSATPTTFTYTLNGGSTATVSVTVTCVDDPPVAVADSASVTEDAVATAISVLANDTDIDAGPKTIASVTQPTNGVVAITGGGTGLTYKPNANYCNTPSGAKDTFSYTLTPGGSGAAVSMTVTCVDDAPVAVNDAATVAEDSGTSPITVLPNDTDIDGGTKLIASTTQPASGTVAITGSGTGLTYTTAANFCSATPTTFTYTLNGGSTATVSVTVTCVDDPPVAVNDAATVTEDAAATAVNVLANDTDVDAGPKTVGAVTQPANGTVVITGGGTGLTYQPAANYCNNPPGTTLSTFTYTLTPGTSTATVTMTVTCVDDPPVAVNDAATVTEDAAATAVNVLANDTDVDGGAAKSIVSVTQPANGTVVITGGGTGLTYQPNANYCNNPPGTTLSTFTYTLTPGTSTATVAVTVTCVDDAPVAVNDSATVNEDILTTVPVLSNDTDIDGGPKLVSSVTQPANGAVAITGGGTGLTYQGATNYCNTPSGAKDTFTYTLSPGGTSATVSITVTCVDDPPVAVADTATVLEDSGITTIPVMTNDTDADGGPMSIASVSQAANGSPNITGAGTGLTYAPNANYCNTPSGPKDTFTYTLNGGSTTTVSVTVTCVNDAPTAVGDTYDVIGNTGLYVGISRPSGQAGKEVSGSVHDNDTDPDTANASLFVEVLTNAPTTLGGKVTMAADGTFAYQPDLNDTNVTDTFTYRVCDTSPCNASAPRSSTATVSLKILAKVWYVKNNQAAGGDGTSDTPFDTLAEAQAASGQGDTTFVFIGSGSSTNLDTGYVMNVNERLIGERVALTIDPDLNGSLPTVTLYPAAVPASFPRITANSGDVMSLASGAVVDGFFIELQGGAGGGIYGGATVSDVTVSHVFMQDNDAVATQPGIEMDGTSGTNVFSEVRVELGGFVLPDGVTFNVVPSTEIGVRLNNAGTVIFDPASYNEVSTSGSKALDITNTNMGTSQWDSVSADSTSTGGIRFNNVSGIKQFGYVGLSSYTGGSSIPLFDIQNSPSVQMDPTENSIVQAGDEPVVNVVNSTGSSIAFRYVSAQGSPSYGINWDSNGDSTFNARDAGSYFYKMGSTAVVVNGGSGDFTFAGQFLDDSHAGISRRIVEVSGRTGGTVNFSGPIDFTNYPGGQIVVNGNTGGNVVFSGAQKTIRTGTLDAVLITNNSSSGAVRFTNGGLDIGTTTGQGLVASSNQAALEVSGPGNVITTTTGRALNIIGTPISANDMTFRSISTSGAPNGILLNGTGSVGNLAVTGNGGVCTFATPTCTGGNIASSTGDGISLLSTLTPSFALMNVHDGLGNGLFANDVTGLTIDSSIFVDNANEASEANLRLQELNGTSTITNSLFREAQFNDIYWNPSTSTSTMNWTNNTVGPDNPGENSAGFLLNPSATAAVTLTVTGGSFTGINGDALAPTGAEDSNMNVTVTGGTQFTDNIRGVGFSIDSHAGLTYHVTGANFLRTISNAMQLVTSDTSQGQLIKGVFSNNTIGNGTADSGSRLGNGIFYDMRGVAGAWLTVQGNTIRNIELQGILIQSGRFPVESPNAGGTVDLYVQGNTVANIDNTSNFQYGTQVDVYQGSNTCLNMLGNTSTGVGSVPDGAGFRVAQHDGSEFRLEGMTTDGANRTLVQNYINARNAAGSTSSADYDQIQFVGVPAFSCAVAN